MFKEVVSDVLFRVTETCLQIQNVLQLGPREDEKHPHQHLVWRCHCTGGT